MEQEKINIVSEIQKYLVDIFEKINNDFLDEGIFWFAHSGTLLGVVRHKGIIPWDDDIDMGMTYLDFVNNKEKIISILEKHNMKLLDLYEEDNIYIKFISNKEYEFLYGGEKLFYKPFIDVMLTIPSNSLPKNSLLYMLSTIPGRVMAMYNNKNIPSWYLHFLLPKKIILRKIKKRYKRSLNIKSDLQIKYDYWMERKFIYDLNSFKIIDFYNTKIWINKNHIFELDSWYKGNWREEKVTEPHIFKYQK